MQIIGVDRRRVRPILTVWLMATALLVALGGGAQAADAAVVTDEARVVLSGTVDVARGETVRDLIVLHGAVNVDGVVDGSVVVLDGPVAVRGTVTRDVVAVNGTVVVEDGGHIGHDLVSPRSPRIARGATIDGTVHRVRTDWGLRSVAVPWFWSWLAVSVSTLALGALLTLLAPQAVDAALTTVRTRPGGVLAGVAVAMVGLPAVAVLAIITVIGIPFGVGLLLAFALLYAVGYVALAWLAGRVIRPGPGSELSAFAVGWVILRVAALVPIIEGLLWFPGAAVGLGVLGAAAWRARRPSSAPAPPTLPAAGAPA
ncbi:MAG TPA: hypothetical protein VFZ70_09390 [Euzebyales bacterium]